MDGVLTDRWSTPHPQHFQIMKVDKYIDRPTKEYVPSH
jgi:hypothetical protein